MEQILTKKEKLRYAHWCIWPGMFWLISVWFWVSALLTGLVVSLTLNPALSFLHTLPSHTVWYGNALVYMTAVIYVILCTFVGFGSMYTGCLLYYFFCDKDIVCQTHFKRYHICKNYACFGCHKKNICLAAR